MLLMYVPATEKIKECPYTLKSSSLSPESRITVICNLAGLLAQPLLHLPVRNYIGQWFFEVAILSLTWRNQKGLYSYGDSSRF
jgi:hypothetical protein